MSQREALLSVIKSSWDCVAIPVIDLCERSLIRFNDLNGNTHNLTVIKSFVSIILLGNSYSREAACMEVALQHLLGDANQPDAIFKELITGNRCVCNGC